jgi:hypothetical protein
VRGRERDDVQFLAIQQVECVLSTRLYLAHCGTRSYANFEKAQVENFTMKEGYLAERLSTGCFYRYPEEVR